jgi:hypothetical protein
VSHKVGPIAISALAVATGVLAGQALAGDVSKGKQVTVAHGRFAHRTWSLAVQGRRKQRCYVLTFDSSHQSSATGTCDPDRRPPLWRRVMGNSDVNDSATVELDITRNRVRHMRLRIGHPRTNRPSEWIHVRNRRITRRQADKANVRRDWRFAVLHSRGTLKRVILFNRKDHRIKDLRVPCEG